MSQLTSSSHLKEDNILDWFDLLSQQLASSQQRVLISCQGTQQYCDRVFDRLLSRFYDYTVLSNRALVTTATPFSKSEVLLGLEFGVVIVDLFDGLNPDVIAIAGGLVKSGGMLILLSQKPTNWSITDDQYACWQNEVVSPEATFIKYFFDRVAADSRACLRICEDQDLPEIPSLACTQATAIIDGKTREQAEILHQVNTWLRHPQSKFTLITANRGRGKSVCLGFIGDELVRRQQSSVCVTAYSRAAAEKLLVQLDDAIFASPDALIKNPVEADVLLIDEAAMLPYPVLTQLCTRYKQVVMATTTGGYEGTGQGFLLRFVARLPASQLLQLEIHDPVRWSAKDNLEKWLNACLLLDSGSADALGDPLKNDDNYRVLTRNDSQADIRLLLDIYRLMVSAHYRTRPSDLRALMENPDLLVVLAEREGQLQGVALLNAEGGIEETLCHQIYLGERRPKGHLLAQMLTAQASSKTFAKLRGLRIQRIAVLESRRRQGIGRQLVVLSRRFAAEHDYDYIGASFAFESESACFWKACEFNLTHISYAQGKSSGNHSVAVINPISPVCTALLGDMQQRIQSSLALWFCQYLVFIDRGSVIALLRYCGYAPRLSQFEIDEINAFGTGHKGFELCFVSLQKLVMQAVVVLPEDYSFHPWVIEKIVQNRDWKQLSKDKEIVGRKAIQSKLRELVDQILQADIGLLIKPDTIGTEQAGKIK